MNRLVLYRTMNGQITKVHPGIVYQKPIPIPNPIKMKPVSYKSQPDPDVCLICQDNFEDGNRITMCKDCRIHLHYRCQLEWLYFYSPVWNRHCCHCKKSWNADHSTIQIVKN